MESTAEDCYEVGIVIATVTDLFLRAYGHYTGYHPGKWRLFERLYPLAQPSWNSRRMGKVDGCRFDCDLHDYVQREIYYLGLEPHQVKYLRKFVNPGWTVLDVGANCGYYSVLMAKWVGERGRVYAFEPSPRNLPALRRNLDLNHGAKVQVCQAALGDRAGFCDMEETEAGNFGMDRIGSGSSIPVTTLDSWLKENSVPRVDFIKVDIEGSETRFLRGAAATLREFRPAMLIEINPGALSRFESTEEELEGTLRELQYDLFDFNWTGIVPYRRPPGKDWFRTVLALRCRQGVRP